MRSSAAVRGESVIVKDTAACPGGAGVKEAEEVAERVARAESVGERVAGGDAVAKAVGSVAVALCEEMVVMEAEGELKNEGEALIDAVDGTESVAPGDGVTTEDGGTVGAVDCEVGGVGSPLADAKEGVGSDVPTSELLARPDALPSMVGVAVLVPPPPAVVVRLSVASVDAVDVKEAKAVKEAAVVDETDAEATAFIVNRGVSENGLDAVLLANPEKEKRPTDAEVEGVLV